MLDSKYVEGIKIAPFDGKVTEAIEEYSLEGGGKTMVVGVQNMDGDTYRVIHALGMSAYINITSGLARIGLTDQLCNSIQGKNGFDSMFVVSESLKSSLNQQQEAHKPTVLEDLEEEESSFKELEKTEKDSIIQSRLGQGAYRQSLIDYWQGCAVTDCSYSPLLRASHIKPWRASNNIERLDPFNGLLLSPNLDVAFDTGYISFDKKGKIIISSALIPVDAYSLRITPKLRIKTKLLSIKHQAYLEYHRAEVLKNG